VTNIYPPGQCTWWCANQEPWCMRYGNLGNAWSWAQAWAGHGGYVSLKPAVGTIACFQPGVDDADAGTGHVAVVVSVAPGSVTVSEMNGPDGPGHTDDRVCAVVPGVSFLYENEPVPKPGAVMKATFFQGPDSTIYLFVPTGPGQFITIFTIALVAALATAWGISGTPIQLTANDVTAWKAAYP
jgi:surface antigen